MSGQYLDYNENNRLVPLIDYGPRLGLGIFSFNFGGYWNSHYRHQSWYGQSNHYNRIVVRHGFPRQHGYYLTPSRSTTVVNRHDRYDRQPGYQRNNARRDYRRHARNDVRHDRQDVRRDVRNHARNDRREIRRDGRSDNRQVRSDSRAGTS